jgi:hypothetical protein
LRPGLCAAPMLRGLRTFLAALSVGGPE